jgi:hypothetical protein
VTPRKAQQKAEQQKQQPKDDDLCANVLHRVNTPNASSQRTGDTGQQHGIAA